MNAGPGTVIVYQAPWDWNFLWNRAQPLATALSRHAEVHYLNSGVDGPPQAWAGPARLLARLPGGSRWHRQRIETVGPQLAVWTWQGLEPDPVRMIREDRPVGHYDRLRRHLWHQAAAGARVWLLTSRPQATRLRHLHAWDRVVVDIEDPWFDLNWGKAMNRADAIDAIRDADVVFGNGPAIAAEYQSLSERQVVSLPNGVDAAFLDLLGRDLPAPDFYRDAGADRRAVFTGNVNDRLDFAMLAEVVAEPGWAFFFVGQDSVPPDQRQAWHRISGRPNVRVVPPLPHREIAAVLQHADALLLPYARGGHEKMFPAKLFEYAATGRPIVGTIDFTAGAFAIPSAVICGSAAEFRTALRRIRDGDSVLKADAVRECAALARRNTWDARAVEFMDVVADVPARRQCCGRDDMKVPRHVREEVPR
jgi:glycosyltransferase involved in cell wall biosynthesis